MKTIVIGELDQIHLVPLDGATLADAFAESEIQGARQSIAHDADGMPIMKDGEMTVIEVLADLVGGCLVRIAPMMGDVAEMASFIGDETPVEKLIECEEAAGRALDFVETMGGLAAMRVKGKWRPIDTESRADWSRHLVLANGQKLRKQPAANDVAPDAIAA